MPIILFRSCHFMLSSNQNRKSETVTCKRSDLEDLLLNVSWAVETLKENGHPETAQAILTKYTKIANCIGFTGRLNVFNNLLRK